MVYAVARKARSGENIFFMAGGIRKNWRVGHNLKYLVQPSYCRGASTSVFPWLNTHLIKDFTKGSVSMGSSP
jgi:hypothetical protein